MKYDKKNKNSGFEVPEGYFGNLEERIMQAVSCGGKIPVGEGFEVPEDYLDGIEDRVMKTIEKERTKSGNTVRKKKIPVYSLRDIAYAASSIAAAAVILFAVFHLNSPFQGRSDNYSITHILPEEVESYIENDLLYLHTQDIAELFDTNDLVAISFTSIGEDDLIHYLEENITNYSDITFDD